MGKARVLFLTTLALVVGLIWPAAPIGAQSNREEIRDFRVTLEVGLDGGVAVTEAIDYFFPSARHGIYRDIPTHYQDGEYTWTIPISVTSVADENGQAWPYQIYRGSAGLQIKIGDPNRTISGLHTYVIRYQASGAVRRFDEQDELFWNATGTEWKVPILKSSAQVSLPAEVAVSAVRCFTGAFGSDSEDCQKSFSGQTADFAATGNLTVVVGWPSGTVAALPPVKVVAASQSDQPTASAAPTQSAPPRPVNPWWPLFAVIPPGLAFVVMYSYWKKHGRDAPAGRALVVQYDPPDGMPPGEMGTLFDTHAEIQDIIATIVDLAVRGYMKIEEYKKKGLIFSSKDYRLHRLKDFLNDPTLKSYEVRVMDTIFGIGRMVSLSALKTEYAFQDQLSKIKNEMVNQVVFDGYYGKDPAKTRFIWLASAAVLASILGIVGLPVLVALDQMFGIPTAATAVSCLLALVIIVMFGWQMPKPTPKGADAIMHAKGFREYLAQAERYRIEWQEKENIFETFLPYAMVFGIAEKWTKAFEGIELKKPDWYEGEAFQAGAFNIAAFSSGLSSLSGAISSTVTARPAPSSSGSGFSSGGFGGGGGFSGGGGGGGGGGSW